MGSQKKRLLIMTMMILILAGCRIPAKLTPDPPTVPTIYANLLKTITVESAIEGIPSETMVPQITSGTATSAVTPTKTPDPGNLVWVHPGLPDLVLETIINAGTFTVIEDASSDAQFGIQVQAYDGGPLDEKSRLWVYALVAPFFNLLDEVTFTDLQAFWQGQAFPWQISQIYVTETTRAAMETILGIPNEQTVKTVPAETLDDIALSNENILVILPFEHLQPIWKVIRIDQTSPIHPSFDPSGYPLEIRITIEGHSDNTNLIMPDDNFDPDKRTILAMTGVTALVRATAYQMEINGVLFPAQDIREWLVSADLTHISNEVPFANDCPFPDPNQSTLIFCSDPKYIELLDYIGTDIVELSGNHLLDWGVDAAYLSLEMYEEKGWVTYAAGQNLADAQSPAFISHNNHQFAFLGCNPAGPASAWATSTQPGTAPCGDYEWLITEITQLKSEGYIPIVTFQYLEDYTAYPSSQMVIDFERMVDAGAVVVNGSQAHTPKMMSFYNGGFIHYGLGNLFFDQMEVYYNDIYLDGTRDEFIDRLVFYDGELISVELLTALLEDYARPRPMTPEERAVFLNRIFEEALSER